MESCIFNAEHFFMNFCKIIIRLTTNLLLKKVSNSRKLNFLIYYFIILIKAIKSHLILKNFVSNDNNYYCFLLYEWYFLIKDVTPQNFMAVLRGDKASVSGIGSGRVLERFVSLSIAIMYS